MYDVTYANNLTQTVTWTLVLTLVLILILLDIGLVTDAGTEYRLLVILGLYRCQTLTLIFKTQNHY